MVEFKDEEFVKKAVSTMNKYDLNGRPLNIKEVRIRSVKSVFSSGFSLESGFGEKNCSRCFRTPMANTPGVRCSAWEELSRVGGVRTWAQPG